MSRYLVGNLTPERWYIAPEVGWLGPADVQGDALRDLRVTDGELSVFEIADDASQAHIERIVVALAAKGKEEPVEIGYRLLDSAEVKRLGIQVLTTNGTLGDKELNKLHRNLTHVTATTLAELANTLAHSPGGIVSEESFERILRKEVQQKRLLASGVHAKLRGRYNL